MTPTPIDKDAQQQIQALYAKGPDYLEYMTTKEERDMVVSVMEAYPKDEKIQAGVLALFTSLLPADDLVRVVSHFLRMIRTAEMTDKVISRACEYIEMLIHTDPDVGGRIAEMRLVLSRCKVAYRKYIDE